MITSHALISGRWKRPGQPDWPKIETVQRATREAEDRMRHPAGALSIASGLLASPFSRVPVVKRRIFKKNSL
jgi:hypothetical protein